MQYCAGHVPVCIAIGVHQVVNWKAAAADETKKMWAIFDETGIFICVCRHGLILWITDMVRSGEL